MNILKRTLLYLLTNLLVVATISIVTNLLGLHGYLRAYGIDYSELISLCLIWGMTSSLLALWMSRWTARVFMQVKLIDSSQASLEERTLIQTVQNLARRLGLNNMPQVGIYESTDVNAFATGPTKNRSLIAVSKGLLAKMDMDEIEGVLAHEMSHVNNGDMVTMTLLQGVVNAFSLFLSRMIAYILSTALAQNKEKNQSRHFTILYSALCILLDVFITLLGSLIVAAFSRYREYRADRGGARLVGRQKMIAALKRLRSLTLPPSDQLRHSLLENLTINKRPSKFKLLSLLATHPDIDLRIEALSK